MSFVHFGNSSFNTEHILYFHVDQGNSKLKVEFTNGVVRKFDCHDDKGCNGIIKELKEQLSYKYQSEQTTKN